MAKNQAKKIEAYKEKQLPSDCGVIVEETRGKVRSFIPTEAIQSSTKARRQHPKPTQKPAKSDPFSEEKVAPHQPVVDSSQETIGG